MEKRLNLIINHYQQLLANEQLKNADLTAQLQILTEAQETPTSEG